MKRYNLVRNQPVARFFYRGDHVHPVRRTVLVVENTKDMIIGYEVRCGNNVVDTKNAPIKSYRKDRITRYGQYCGIYRAKKYAGQNPNRSTLTRTSLTDFIFNGA